MPRTRQVDFASEPAQPSSELDELESPTRRKSKPAAKPAAKKTAPNPPKNPPMAMPRPKMQPAPTDRVTRAGKVAAAVIPAQPVPVNDAASKAPAKKTAAQTKRALANARIPTPPQPRATPKRAAKVPARPKKAPARKASARRVVRPLSNARHPAPSLLAHLNMDARAEQHVEEGEDEWEEEEDIDLDRDDEEEEDNVDADDDADDDVDADADMYEEPEYDDGYISPVEELIAARSHRYSRPSQRAPNDVQDDQQFKQPVRVAVRCLMARLRPWVWVRVRSATRPAEGVCAKAPHLPGVWRARGDLQIARVMLIPRWHGRDKTWHVDVDMLGRARIRSSPHPLRTSVTSVSDVVSPARKKQPPANWDRFVKGRTVDSKLATIPECVKIIVTGGFVQYLPMNLFAPEVLKAEESIRMLLRPDESALSKVPQPNVSELDADPEHYMAWSKKAIVAFKVLGVPEDIIEMFEEHFEQVQTNESFFTEWPTWRLYDYRRRSLVKGDTPADIRKLDMELFRQCQMVTMAELNAKMRAATDQARRGDRRGGQASTSQSATSRNASTSKQEPAKSKYTRCLVCGSNAHTYDKDTPRDDCKPRWLIFDKVRSAWRTPDTRALLCWAWNGVGGCKKPRCRFNRLGHRCSLCGGDHGTHECQP
ncbi:hypothetical protein EXIGLDRAFT_783467 [Exidia glandulosa HHB12029]|uniref:Uncharacterized protein n=1 Tax=Exidia glandulosa HHB12029 TaxID=1314781 RepID=A0A166N1Q5_EXIGL|nr:hypothetical protein EXIGLDRAFT_783467 [Exidia glandulosa HHB12029]